jgi:hypothetical protein
VIRLEAQRHTTGPPQPELGPLASTLDRSLATMAEAVGDAHDVHRTTLPPLRALYQALGRETEGEPTDAVLVTQLDEIVDATNTIGALVGLEHDQVSAGDQAPAWVSRTGTSRGSRARLK